MSLLGTKLEWKTEPASPEQEMAPDPLDLDIDFCFEDDALTGYDDFEEEAVRYANRGELATKLLHDLDVLVKQEQQFSETQFGGWLEEKAVLPIFDVLPQHQAELDLQQDAVETSAPATLKPLSYVVEPAVIAQPQQVFVAVNQDTSQLLQEFEDVLLNHETLTPPDSPHGEAIFTLLQEMQTDELDQLVASRVDNIYVEGSSGGASSSGSSSPASVDSESTQASDSGYEDPDWVPTTIATSASSPEAAPTKKKRTRATPYGRGASAPDDRKQRKKEQNKNAATRYRQKKKAEVENILDEEKDLKGTNEKLKSQLTDVRREIKYLKGLMRDVFKASGLIK